MKMDPDPLASWQAITRSTSYLAQTRAGSSFCIVRDKNYILDHVYSASQFDGLLESLNRRLRALPIHPVTVVNINIEDLGSNGRNLPAIPHLRGSF